MKASFLVVIRREGTEQSADACDQVCRDRQKLRLKWSANSKERDSEKERVNVSVKNETFQSIASSIRRTEEIMPKEHEEEGHLLQVKSEDNARQEERQRVQWNSAQDIHHHMEVGLVVLEHHPELPPRKAGLVGWPSIDLQPHHGQIPLFLGQEPCIVRKVGQEPQYNACQENCR